MSALQGTLGLAVFMTIAWLLSALSALLFYWRVLPWLVRSASRLLQRAPGHAQ